VSRRERAKGLRGEAEVRALYKGAGFQVRGLEGTGDHLAIGCGLMIHSEVKRQEVLRLPLWTRQAWDEAPAGAIPVVSYRQNGTPWKAAVPEAHVGLVLGFAGWISGIHYHLIAMNGRCYLMCDLGRMLGAIASGCEAAGLMRAAQ
jgi:hypothetical protein